MFKNTLTIFLSSAAVFLLILIGTSCSSSTGMNKEPTYDPVFVDNSWLTGKPCSAPCWHGLIPGKTTKNEVLEAVKELPNIMLDTAQEGTVWNNHYTLFFKCRVPLESVCLYMVFQQEALYMLQITPPQNITFLEVVGQFGNPDGFIAERINAEGKGCTVSLFWKDRQTQVSYDEEKTPSIFESDLCDKVQEEDYRIPSDLTVQSVEFMQESLMKIRTERSNFVRWKGFVSK